MELMGDALTDDEIHLVPPVRQLAPVTTFATGQLGDIAVRLITMEASPSRFIPALTDSIIIAVVG
jgi:hypothetical protein